ncbi:MAG: cupin domain-containing protein [Deltaproteobacteria bacterium]|nr:cupin domain-containing protein [Deltaproteobacteria bacterium]
MRGDEYGNQKLRTLLGREPVWNMAPGRTAALKLQNEETGESVMAFEEVTPTGTETPLHLHRDSDEVMYVLSGEYSFKVGDKLSSGGPGACVFHAAQHPSRLEEQWSRNRTGVLHLHSGRGR